jgi:hypothetical protein
MGFSITWCAVREENADPFLQQLGLTPTGETEEHPQSLISTVALHTGWRVIWYNKYDCPFLRPQDLRELSKNTDVLLCLVEEHVMASSAEMWSNGERKWWLSHEGEDGPSGISTDGELPESFPAIREQMEQAQLAAGGTDADPRASIEMQGGTTFHFVTDGIHAALQRAKEAANGQDVRLGGGAATVRDYLRGGLIDELHIAIAPVVLGSGEHLFGDINIAKLGYRCSEHVGTPKATHVVITKQQP